jgi:hypothetical protein
MQRPVTCLGCLLIVVVEVGMTYVPGLMSGFLDGCDPISLGNAVVGVVLVVPGGRVWWSSSFPSTRMLNQLSLINVTLSFQKKQAYSGMLTSVLFWMSRVHDPMLSHPISTIADRRSHLGCLLAFGPLSVNHLFPKRRFAFPRVCEWYLRKMRVPLIHSAGGRFRLLRLVCCLYSCLALPSFSFGCGIPYSLLQIGHGCPHCWQLRMEYRTAYVFIAGCGLSVFSFLCTSCALFSPLVRFAQRRRVSDVISIRVVVCLPCVPAIIGLSLLPQVWFQVPTR